MKSLFKNLNNLNARDQENDDDDSMSNNINSKYYQIDELKKEIVRNGKFSLLHLNIASLGAHKDEFEDVLSILDLDFDILELTETRVGLIKEQIPTMIHLLLGIIRNISHQQNQPKAVLRYISIKILKVKNVYTDFEKNLGAFPPEEASAVWKGSAQ